MTCITKPMLAVAAEIDKLKYPLLASPKLDGIRALRIGGQLLSRKFKPIPNNYVRNMLEHFTPEGVDGELIVNGGSFNSCQSAFMSMDGEPNFCYHVFDYVEGSLEEPFCKRLEKLKLVVDTIFELFPAMSGKIKVVEQRLIHNEKELMEYEERCVSGGYEGIMVRTLDGPYKCGRSTLREALLLKIKRWNDAEGVIISVEEQMRNDNEAEKDELGHTKRSSCKDGMTPTGTLGKFVVEEISTGTILRVGTGVGLTKEYRQDIWDNRDEYIGRIISFKHQPSGAKAAEDGGKARFPIFKGFRDPIDIGE